MKKYKIFTMMVMVIFVLSGCFNQEEPKQEAKPTPKKEDTLNVQQYFPNKIGVTRTYMNYDTEGKPTFTDEETIVKIEPMDKKMKEMTIEVVSDSATNEASIQKYEISKKQVKLVENENAGKDLFQLGGKQIVLSSKAKWKSDDKEKMTSNLSKKNVSLSVKAGDFEDVLVVLEKVKLQEGTVTFKKYFAKKIGMIYCEIKYPNSDVFVPYRELISYDTKKSDKPTTEVVTETEPKQETKPEAEKPEQKTEAKPAQPNGSSALTETFSSSADGFHFSYPGSWKGHIVTDNENWYEGADRMINFHWSEKGLNEQLFFIGIWNQPEEEWRADNEEGSWRILANTNGKIYAYMPVNEPSPELLDPENEDLLKRFQQILSTELPSAMSTFKAQ